MSSLALLKLEQKTLSGRLWSLLWQIRKAEGEYLEFSFAERRNIHQQGAKTRFLLAGIFEHRPSQQKFLKKHSAMHDSNARGPSEFCPVIDIFEDVRSAQISCEEWIKRPQDHTIAHIQALIAKAERVAWNVQVLLAAMKRGGDQTPPLVEGSETLDEFCERLQAHHVMVCSMVDGYDGRWAEVPTNDGKLSPQQIADNWNGVCGLLIQKDLTLEKALKEVQMATREMEFEELSWKGQERVWFEWIPKMAAGTAE